MKINGEECELVTDFATLRSGMIVWRTPCSFCGGKHRGILGALRAGPTRTALERFEHELRFSFFPATGHSQDGSAVSPSSVARGCVYRVVDPKLAQTTERKREAVRP